MRNQLSSAVGCWQPQLMRNEVESFVLQQCCVHYALVCCVSERQVVVVIYSVFDEVLLLIGWCGGTVLGHQTNDQQVTSSSPGHGVAV